MSILIKVVLSIAIFLTWIAVLGLAINIIEYFDAKVEKIKLDTHHTRYKVIYKKIGNNIDIVADSYISDPRYKTMKVHTIYDNIKQIVLGSISVEDKKFLSVVEPQYEYLISLMILARLQEGSYRTMPYIITDPTFIKFDNEENDDADE